jgi:hypothetical protein
LGRVGAHPIVKLEPGTPSEPSLPELAKRAELLEAESRTGSLRSTRTVLTALLLSATEALEHLSDDPQTRPSLAFESSIAAVGAYLVHACSLEDLPLGQLISSRFDQDAADAAPPQRYGHGS